MEEIIYMFNKLFIYNKVKNKKINKKIMNKLVVLKFIF